MRKQKNLVGKNTLRMRYGGKNKNESMEANKREMRKVQCTIKESINIYREIVCCEET